MRESKQAEMKFTKDDLIGARQFAGKGDLVRALLRDGKEYTLPEADETIQRFLEGKVR